MKIKFAFVSVRSGRKELAKRIEKGEKVPIILIGEIVHVWGHDDGIDQEFEMKVTAIDESRGKRKK